MIGRAMSDVQRTSGTFDSPSTDGGYAVIEGEAPVSEMRDYAMEVNQYAHGHGRFSATFGGYKPCHDAEQVIKIAGYDRIGSGQHFGFGVSAHAVPLSRQMV